MMKELVVLSLFDGMSCGQIALNKLGFKDYTYYASEIELPAIKTTQYNYPNTVQIGDVTKVSYHNGVLSTENGDFNVGNIDLIIGGSPCQSFSLAGTKKGMVTSENIEVTNLDYYLQLKAEGYSFSGQSYLFWEYVRLMKECEPSYFLLENVLMSSKWKKIITDTMNVEPQEINSCLLSIQSRKRLYWSNLEFNTDIVDKGTLFKDNYSKEYDESLVLKGRGLNKIQRPRSRVYSIDSEKLPTLLKEQESKATDSIVIKHDSIYRYPTREEAEKMQTVPVGYTNTVKYNEAMGMLGNGWTVDVIVEIFKPLLLKYKQ